MTITMQIFVEIVGGLYSGFLMIEGVIVVVILAVILVVLTNGLSIWQFLLVSLMTKLSLWQNVVNENKGRNFCHIR